MVTPNEMIDRILLTLARLGSPQAFLELGTEMEAFYSADGLYFNAISDYSTTGYYLIYRHSGEKYVKLLEKGLRRLAEIRSRSSRPRAFHELVVMGESGGGVAAPFALPTGLPESAVELRVTDWSRFSDYVKELITSYHLEKETAEWPTLEILVRLVKNGTRFSHETSETIEKKIRDLSGTSRSKPIKPIGGDQTVILKNLAEVVYYSPKPRSIANLMREILMEEGSIRVSVLFDKLRGQLAPDLKEDELPQFRRMILNMIAKCVDGERFEFVIDPMNPDMTKIRMTNKYLAKELEPRSA